MAFINIDMDADAGINNGSITNINSSFHWDINHRPTSLQYGNYAKLTRRDLLLDYLDDSRRAIKLHNKNRRRSNTTTTDNFRAMNSDHECTAESTNNMPPRPNLDRISSSSLSCSSSTSSSYVLRVCQWNVNSFNPNPSLLADGRRVTQSTERLILDELQRCDHPDIIIINEVCPMPGGGVGRNGRTLQKYKKNTKNQKQSLPIERYRDVLEGQLGYKSHLIATIPYPTGIWTKFNLWSEEQPDDSEEERQRAGSLEETDDVKRSDDQEKNMAIVNLGDDRQAVGLCIEWPNQGSDRSEDSGSIASNCRVNNDAGNDRNKRSRAGIWIYGIHLNHVEFFRGQRYAEMKCLLDHINKSDYETNRSMEPSSPSSMKRHDRFPIIIAGDFNQQRACDYTEIEWARICESKRMRDESSTGSDGVAQLLANNGFKCCFDDDDEEAGKIVSTEECAEGDKESTFTTENIQSYVKKTKNWQNSLPPATHWSGTVIDYAYHRDRSSTGLRNVGTYISPSGVSHHRLVVTDWALL